LAAVVTLTVFGALDKPAMAGRAWNIQERAGAMLVLASERCTRCHQQDGMAAPIEPGRFSKPQSWLAAHAADPEVIGPGVREAPPSNEAETASILAALARLRSGPPPPIDAHTARILTLVNRHCLSCHLIDGVGGSDGPDLTKVGGKIDLEEIRRRIAAPTDVQPDAEMPAFADKLSAEDIADLARWLVTRGRN
jgi:mono/diheme cytochrome c family protein